MKILTELDEKSRHLEIMASQTIRDIASIGINLSAEEKERISSAAKMFKVNAISRSPLTLFEPQNEKQSKAFSQMFSDQAIG
jgi:hypothetical protein